MTPEDRQQQFEQSLQEALTAHNKMLAAHARRLEEQERWQKESERESAQIRQETDHLRQDTEQIRREREQIRRETDRIRQDSEQIRRETDRQRQEHERKMQWLDARIKHGIRLAVREARAERAKRRELDEKMTQLAASHLLTEEALRDLKVTVDSFIQSMRRGGNGQLQA
ncbi:MAG TPA: hypothetical protein VLY24_21770 [Bryobacteraceae bacterium]|nr:hypothetical protein [Bryobacteraceae bacterium]